MVVDDICMYVFMYTYIPNKSSSTRILLTYSTALCELITSHSPSVATMINWSFLEGEKAEISGSGTTMRLFPSFNWQSPNALAQTQYKQRLDYMNICLYVCIHVCMYSMCYADNKTSILLKT